MAEAPPGPARPSTTPTAAANAAYFVICFMSSSLAALDTQSHPGNSPIFQGDYPQGGAYGLLPGRRTMKMSTGSWVSTVKPWRS